MYQFIPMAVRLTFIHFGSDQYSVLTLARISDFGYRMENGVVGPVRRAVDETAKSQTALTAKNNRINLNSI